MGAAGVACILLSTPRNEAPMDLDGIVGRVRQEFLDMPGLRLTPEQAGRLWGLERDICQAVIDQLVASAFLCWTRAGAVMRLDA